MTACLAGLYREYRMVSASHGEPRYLSRGPPKILAYRTPFSVPLENWSL